MPQGLEKPARTVMTEAPRLLRGEFNVHGNIIVAGELGTADQAADCFDRLDNFAVKAVTLADQADTAPIVAALDALHPEDTYFEKGIVFADKNDFIDELPARLSNFWQQTRAWASVKNAGLAWSTNPADSHRYWHLHDKGAAETPPDFGPLIDDIKRIAPLVVPQLGRFVSGLQISFLKVGHDFRPHTHDSFKRIGIRNLSDHGTLLSTVAEKGEMRRENSLQAGRGLTIMTGKTVHSTPDVDRRWIYNITKPMRAGH